MGSTAVRIDNRSLYEIASIIGEYKPDVSVQILENVISSGTGGVVDAELYNALGVARLKANGDIAGSLDAYEKAIAAGGSDPQVYANQAYAKMWNYDLSGAFESLYNALALNDKHEDALVKLYTAYFHSGQYFKAYQTQQKLISITDNPYNRQGLGLTELLLSNMTYDGLFQLGVENFIHRLGMRTAKLANPWRGDARELKGKVINVYLEQGLGDVVMFVPYLDHLVEEMGCRVRVISRGEHDAHLDALAQIYKDSTDVWCETELIYSKDSIPSCDIEMWLFELLRLGVPGKIVNRGSGLEVSGNAKFGLVWRGNPKHPNDRWRSIPFSVLESFIEKNSDKLVCLQDSLKPSEELFLKNSGVEIPDVSTFEKLSVSICSLKGVLSIDSFVGHFAGNLGCPVNLFVPVNTDWRWGYHGSTTPWYSNHKLVRQKCIGEWEGVLNEWTKTIND